MCDFAFPGHSYILIWQILIIVSLSSFKTAVVVFLQLFNFCLLESSADNFCQQFEHRSGLTKHMTILQDFSEKFNFEKKNQQPTKKHAKLTSMPFTLYYCMKTLD